jgi:hypothetical protein
MYQSALIEEIIIEGELILSEYNNEYIREVNCMLKDYLAFEVELKGDYVPLVEKYTVYFENREMYEKGQALIVYSDIKAMKRYAKETIDIVAIICPNDETSEEE